MQRYLYNYFLLFLLLVRWENSRTCRLEMNESPWRTDAKTQLNKNCLVWTPTLADFCILQRRQVGQFSTGWGLQILGNPMPFWWRWVTTWCLKCVSRLCYIKDAGGFNVRDLLSEGGDVGDARCIAGFDEWECRRLLLCLGHCKGDFVSFLNVMDDHGAFISMVVGEHGMVEKTCREVSDLFDGR